MSLRQPWLAGLMRERSLCGWILLASFVLLTGSLLGISLWFCPFRAITGLPCPGCGLTRAVSSMVAGRWEDALQFHPFVPFFGLAWILLFLSVVLPVFAREKLIGWVQRFECKTGLTALLLIAFTAYGLTRMVKVCFSEAGAEIPKVFQRASEPKPQNKTTL
jgi:hypothetical protein